MTDELPHAATLQVLNCTQNCPCQSVHILLLDAEGEPFAAACMPAEIARNIARDLSDKADTAEAQKLKNEGRLS